MEEKNNGLVGLVSVIAITLLSILGVFAIFTTVNKITESLNSVQNGSVGTALTYNANTASYTDGADFRQNVQAIAERFANLTPGYLLQVSTTGNVEAVSPTTVTGTWNFNTSTIGQVRAGTFVEKGPLAEFTSTTAVTSAQLCTSGLITNTSSLSVTLTLPSTTTLFSSCLTTDGDSLSIPLFNGSSTTTIIAAGAGGDLQNSSSTTMSALDAAMLFVVRDVSTSYRAMLVNVR